MKMKQGVLPYYILIVFIKGCEGNRRKTVGAFGNYYLSRLTGSAYSENGSASTHYGTSYQYDLMGNIIGLTRSGLQDDNSLKLITQGVFLELFQIKYGKKDTNTCTWSYK